MRATECFSMNSDMSMRIIASSVSNRNSASALHSSVLPTPVGPRNRNEPFGRRGSDKPGARAADGIRDDAQRLVLAHHALARAPPPCAAASPSRPAASSTPGCRSTWRRLPRSPPRSPCCAPAWAPSPPRRVACSGASRARECLPYCSSAMRARLPARRAASSSSARAVELLADLRGALQRPPSRPSRSPRDRRTPCSSARACASSVARRLRGGLVLFLLQRLPLDLQLDDAPLEPVERLGLGVDLHADARRRLVDQVDRLVGQLAVGDVAVRQRRGGDDRRIGDLDLWCTS